MKRGALGLIVGVGSLVAALSAPASVPRPERIETAVAKTNTKAGRGRALQIEFVMQVGDRSSVAEGVLVTDPAGMARLELRGANGLLERHLLHGGERSAARNGETLTDFRYFLPPLFVLQAATGRGLHELLLGLNISPDAVGLAECGEGDCLVMGDLTHAVGYREPPVPLGLELYHELVAFRLLEEAALEEMRRARWSLAPHFEIGSERFDVDLRAWELPGPVEHPTATVGAEAGSGIISDSADPLLSQEELPPEVEAETLLGEFASPELALGSDALPGAEFPEEVPEQPLSPRLWVDRASFEIRGMDASGGTSIRLGPAADFQGLRVPAWIRIEEPGKREVLFDVVKAFAVEPAAEAFSRGWLFAPPADFPQP
jgi:hypothetical protein